MRFEAAFVAGYGWLLLAAAVGLHRLGRVNSSPWASRLLAAYRRQAPDPFAADPLTPEPVVAEPLGRDAEPGWPHTDARRLHTGIAVVASAAALLLACVELARHHRPAESVLLGGAAVAAGALLVRLAAALRPSAGP